MAIPFGVFVRYVRTSPSLIAKLLARAPAVQQRVTAEAVADVLGDLPTDGVERVEELPALPTSITHSKDAIDAVSSLYKLFRQLIIDNQLDELALTQQEVIDYLVESHIPLICHFMLDRLVYAWDPDNCHFSAILFEDDHASRACKKYLVDRGAVYSSLEAVSRVAVEQQWPGWQAIANRR